MALKVMNLFDAFNQNELPTDQGYIVSSFVNTRNGYIIYEVICYSAVKAIYPDAEGLTFQSSGKKMHMLVEPPSYPNKAIEPYLREDGERIPLRFSELNIHTAKNQTKIYIAKKPTEALTSFTVAKPMGFDISFLFYKLPDIYETMGKFFEKAFNKDAKIPQVDAAKASKVTMEIIEKHMGFKSNFGD